MIHVQDLVKNFGEVAAVAGVSFDVRAGEIFAFLGPNGAGKTTTVEILEGYRRRDAGEVTVLGVDPARATRAWRQRVGFVLQECRLTPELTVREAIEQYAGYYPAPRDVGETISLVGLDEKADARTSTLSGGQQRRLDVAVALIGDPDLLFLDEPTTGFDPSARRQAWGMIASLRQLGKTVFLTTHYMDEAQRLADRVAIIAGGEIVAQGTPETLGDREVQPTQISFKIARGAEPPLDGAVAGPDGTWTLTSRSPAEPLHRLTGWALERGVELEGLEVRRPSLEDVYLELTGGDASEELGSG